METFDIGSLESCLRALPTHRHRLTFGGGVCERLLPNYDAFVRETGWGDTKLLRQGISMIWQIVEGGSVPLAHIREVQATIRLATPDSENFSSDLTSAAIDAASAVHETLEACYRDEPKRIADVGSFAHDTVHMYVQRQQGLAYTDPGFEERMAANRLMTRELAKQRHELDVLARSPILSAEFVTQYRAGAAYGGRSNLDVA